MLATARPRDAARAHDLVDVPHDGVLGDVVALDIAAAHEYTVLGPGRADSAAVLHLEGGAGGGAGRVVGGPRGILLLQYCHRAARVAGEGHRKGHGQVSDGKSG